MRVGIVGGGAAGLVAAWLLDQEHEVTLFERQAYLGGHAHTLDIALDSEQEPRRVSIDSGPEFLSIRLYPTVLRLIQSLSVPTLLFPLTVALYHTDGGRPLLMPPVQRGRIAWSTFQPRTLRRLLQLQRVLDHAPTRLDLDAKAFTVEETLDAFGADEDFRRELFYPMALSGWCVEMEDFRTYAAYNVLHYLSLSRPSGLTPSLWVDIIGGMRTYIEAVERDLRRTQVHRSAQVTTASRDGTTWRLTLANGGVWEGDALIVATNATQARGLLSDTPEVSDLRAVLQRVEYSATRIAIHGDERLMPPRRRDWSVVNTRFDGVHSQNTMWKSWLQPSEGYVFKSWVTYEDTLPHPLYALLEFQHPKVNRAYFEAQRALAPLQGRDGLWIAGVYTADVDSHESAMRSAVRIAEQLAPGSARLRTLTAE